MQSTDPTFEEPLIELRRRIEELEGYPAGGGHEKELERLRTALRKNTSDIFTNLSRWEKTLVARHQDRPYTLDYVEALMSDWVEVHGDRAFADDAAIVSGLAEFRGRSVAVIGHQKGEAADATKLTAPDLLQLGVVDAIIPEPPGGAHTDPAVTCQRVGDAVEGALKELERLSPRDLVDRRCQKFRALGAYDEG